MDLECVVFIGCEFVVEKRREDNILERVTKRRKGR